MCPMFYKGHRGHQRSGPVVFRGDDVPIHHQGGIPGADRGGDGDEDALTVDGDGGDGAKKNPLTKMER